MLLPLDCYDEAGRVKPPLWLNSLLLLLCSDWLALVFSLLTFGKTSELLGMLYPDKTMLGIRLLATMPFVMVLLLTGNRERLWKKGWTEWRRCIRPLLFTGMIASVLAQITSMNQQHWVFHWTPALFLLGNLGLLVTVLKSIHLSAMLTDWRYREQNETDALGDVLTESVVPAPAQNNGKR